MDDFAVPTRGDPYYLLPTIPNYIEPGKRPQSSTTPTILLDRDEVKMVVGASGGVKITTATAQVNNTPFKLAAAMSTCRKCFQKPQRLTVYKSIH